MQKLCCVGFKFHVALSAAESHHGENWSEPRSAGESRRQPSGLITVGAAGMEQ
jgi:hypothetical protein